LVESWGLPQCVGNQLGLPLRICAGANGAEGGAEAFVFNPRHAEVVVDGGDHRAEALDLSKRVLALGILLRMERAARRKHRHGQWLAQAFKDVRLAHCPPRFNRTHARLFFLGAGPNTSGRISYRETLPPDAFSISNTRLVGQMGTNFHWLMAER
jgi:hypothetical protein